ncbi:MAG: GLPGLI family protein [Bacteroidota bacterium]
MKYRFLIIAWLCMLNLSSQTKGKITYRVSIDKSSIEKPYENPENTEAKNAALEMIHESVPVEAYLVFRDSVSLYYVEDKTEIPKWENINGAISITPVPLNMTWSMAGRDATFYTDWTRDYDIRTSNTMNKSRRIVKTPLSWEITEDTKMIQGYLCYKAILATKENRVAWFTKAIPLPHGPRGFNGLPGMVLEVQDNKISFTVTTIEMDHPEVDDIVEPKEGELISEEEFREWSKTIMSGN